MGEAMAAAISSVPMSGASRGLHCCTCQPSGKNRGISASSNHAPQRMVPDGISGGRAPRARTPSAPVDRSTPAARHGAADAYQALYKHTPSAEYRQRYRELTEEQLSEPLPLPDLPEVALQVPASLVELIERINQMSVALTVDGETSIAR